MLQFSIIARAMNHAAALLASSKRKLNLHKGKKIIFMSVVSKEMWVIRLLAGSGAHTCFPLSSLHGWGRNRQVPDGEV